MQVESFTFAIAAVAFFGLAVAAVTGWRERLRDAWLTPALLAEALRCAATALAASGSAIDIGALAALESLRGIAWIGFLAWTMSGLLERDVPRLLVGGALMVALLALAAAILPSSLFAASERALFLLDLRRWNGLLLAITVLVLLEQFARNSREPLQWGLRYLSIGIGVLFAHDLCVWSVALLVTDVNDVLLQSRGVIGAAVAAPIALALRRIDRLGPGVIRSSGTLFFNGTLVITGFYVLLMAAVSYLLRAFGTGSGPLVEAVFFGASMLVLAVAAFSGQFRAWFRVTVSKRLGLYRYNYREQWLALTRALSPTDEISLYERVPAIIASFVDVRQGALFLRDESGGYRRAGGNLPLAAPAFFEAAAFVDDLARREWILDLHAQAGPGGEAATTATPGGVPIPQWLSGPARAWLVVPLVCNEAPVGFVVIGEPVAPQVLGWEQLDVLRVSGRQAASHLAFEQAATRLAEMHQFAALNRLSGFVMHDLRHLVAQLALVVDNAARHRRNPEFIDDAMLTIDSAAQRMNRLMEVLRTGVDLEPARRIDLVDLCRDAISRCAGRQPQPKLEGTSETLEVMANRDRLGAAIEHLVRNAQDATGASGSVTVRLGRRSHSACIDIVDTGRGMEPEFMSLRLFRPFESTKGERGMGLGAFEAREIVRKMGGAVTVESTVGVGTRFEVTLPLAAASSG